MYRLIPLIYLNSGERLKSLLSYGYYAGYIKDKFGCNKQPCKCAGFDLKDKTVIGLDIHFLYPFVRNEGLVYFHISLVIKIIIHQGDILLTPQTASRLIPVRPLLNNKYSAALTNTSETLWTENKQAGYYIIGYIINDKLDTLNKKTIPEVMILI